MSDDLRKGVGDKAQEKLTPQSEKSTLDKAKEGVTDTTDKLAAQVQPDSEKSITQQASDSLSGKPGEKTYLEQAQDTASSALKTAQDTATDLYNKASDSLSGSGK